MWRNRSGFTFIEIIVVVAIIIILFGGAAVSLNSYQGANNVQAYNNDLEKIQTLISKAHAYAKSSRLDDNWGIKRLEQTQAECDSSTTVNCFVLFKGNDYATRNSDFDEVITYSSNLIGYDNTNAENEIYYKKITGWGGNFDVASTTDVNKFIFVSTDATYDCDINVGILGVVYKSCN